MPQPRDCNAESASFLRQSCFKGRLGGSRQIVEMRRIDSKARRRALAWNAIASAALSVLASVSASLSVAFSSAQAWSSTLAWSAPHRASAPASGSSRSSPSGWRIRAARAAVDAAGGGYTRHLAFAASTIGAETFSTASVLARATVGARLDDRPAGIGDGQGRAVRLAQRRAWQWQAWQWRPWPRLGSSAGLGDGRGERSAQRGFGSGSRLGGGGLGGAAGLAIVRGFSILVLPEVDTRRCWLGGFAGALAGAGAAAGPAPAPGLAATAGLLQRAWLRPWSGSASPVRRPREPEQRREPGQERQASREQARQRQRRAGSRRLGRCGSSRLGRGRLWRRGRHRERRRCHRQRALGHGLDRARLTGVLDPACRPGDLATRFSLLRIKSAKPGPSTRHHSCSGPAGGASPPATHFAFVALRRRRQPCWRCPEQRRPCP